MNIISINQIKNALFGFWAKHGCAKLESYDLPVGAATFHLHTLLSLVKPKLRNIMFTQRCRRPQDARGSMGKDRLMQHTQFQVMMTPSPENIQELVCESLYACGIDRGSLIFVENNWKSPTLGASGKGYEVLSNGTEVMQFTYFQKFGSYNLKDIPIELAYGVERIGMITQKCDDMFELVYDNDITHGDVYSEFEDDHFYARYDENVLRDLLKMYLDKLNVSPVIVAYETFVMANYTFNVLESCGNLSFYERDNLINQLRAKTETIMNRLMSKEDIDDKDINDA